MAGAGAADLFELPLSLIDRDPSQPRKRFDATVLELLAESLRTAGVLVQPIRVRPRGPRFEIVAGERRWRAAHLAGWDTIPAIVEELDDATARRLALIENVTRENLSPIEEARAAARLCDVDGLTKAAVGRLTGVSREAISNLIRLLALPDDVLELIDTRKLSEGHGRALLLCDDHDRRSRLARQAAAGDWSVRRLESAARAKAGPPIGSGSGQVGESVGFHPDQIAAMHEIGELLGGPLGREPVIEPDPHGYRVSVYVSGPDDAAEMLRRARES
jgi:ParB family chromosome partitioning protein